MPRSKSQPAKRGPKATTTQVVISYILRRLKSNKKTFPQYKTYQRNLHNALNPNDTVDPESFGDIADAIVVIVDRQLTSHDKEWIVKLSNKMKAFESKRLVVELNSIAQSVFRDGGGSWSRIVGMLELMTHVSDTFGNEDQSSTAAVAADWLINAIKNKEIGKSSSTILDWINDFGGWEAIIREAERQKPLKLQPASSKRILPIIYRPFQSMKGSASSKFSREVHDDSAMEKSSQDGSFKIPKDPLPKTSNVQSPCPSSSRESKDSDQATYVPAQISSESSTDDSDPSADIVPQKRRTDVVTDTVVDLAPPESSTDVSDTSVDIPPPEISINVRDPFADIASPKRRRDLISLLPAASKRSHVDSASNSSTSFPSTSTQPPPKKIALLVQTADNPPSATSRAAPSAIPVSSVCQPKQGGYILPATHSILSAYLVLRLVQLKGTFPVTNKGSEVIEKMKKQIHIANYPEWKSVVDSMASVAKTQLSVYDRNFIKDKANTVNKPGEEVALITNVAEKVFRDGMFSWSRIIGLLELGVKLVCNAMRFSEVIPSILTHLTDIINKYGFGNSNFTILHWIQTNGGWSDVISVALNANPLPEVQVDETTSVPLGYRPFQHLRATLQGNLRYLKLETSAPSKPVTTIRLPNAPPKYISHSTVGDKSKVHILVGSNTLPCRKCGKTIKIKRSYETTGRCENQSCTIYWCLMDSCKFENVSMEIVEKHQSYSHPNKPGLCNRCRAIKTRMPLVEKGKCPVCKVLWCTFDHLCTFETFFRDDMLRHQVIFHDKCHAFTCVNCGAPKVRGISDRKGQCHNQNCQIYWCLDGHCNFESMLAFTVKHHAILHSNGILKSISQNPGLCSCGNPKDRRRQGFSRCSNQLCKAYWCTKDGCPMEFGNETQFAQHLINDHEKDDQQNDQ